MKCRIVLKNGKFYPQKRVALFWTPFTEWVDPGMTGSFLSAIQLPVAFDSEDEAEAYVERAVSRDRPGVVVKEFEVYS